MLESYFLAFAGSDTDVLLRIRSSVPDFIGGDKNITSKIEVFKSSYLARHRVGQKLPEVVWEQGGRGSRSDVRDALSSADSFVLASRGEGNPNLNPNLG